MERRGERGREQHENMETETDGAGRGRGHVVVRSRCKPYPAMLAGVHCHATLCVVMNGRLRHVSRAQTAMHGQERTRRRACALAGARGVGARVRGAWWCRGHLVGLVANSNPMVVACAA